MQSQKPGLRDLPLYWMGYNFWVIASVQRICLSLWRLQFTGKDAERGEQKGSLRGTRSKAVFASIERTGFGLVGDFENEPITAKRAKNIWLRVVMVFGDGRTSRPNR